MSGIAISSKRKSRTRFRRVQPPMQQASATELPKLSTQAEELTVDNNKQIFEEYRGQVYIHKRVDDWKVDFVITRNVDSHLTVSMPTIISGAFH